MASWCSGPASGKGCRSPRCFQTLLAGNRAVSHGAAAVDGIEPDLAGSRAGAGYYTLRAGLGILGAAARPAGGSDERVDAAGPPAPELVGSGEAGRGAAVVPCRHRGRQAPDCYLRDLGFAPARIASLYDVVDNEYFARQAAEQRRQTSTAPCICRVTIFFRWAAWRRRRTWKD